jgi:hypothetical protein
MGGFLDLVELGTGSAGETRDDGFTPLAVCPLGDK